MVNLTPRQLEVARLVHAARQNHEIAEELVLSPRTVQRHVDDIFTRLDLRNRVELALYVERGGLR